MLLSEQLHGNQTDLSTVLSETAQVLFPGTIVVGHNFFPPHLPCEGRFSLTFIHSPKLVLGHVAQHQTASSLLKAQLWKKSRGR